MAWTPEMRDKAAQTRQRNKEARAAEKISAQGYGESRVFRDPDAPDPYEKVRNCHVGGKLVGEVFNESQIALLSYEQTDEGIAQRNAGKSEHRVSVVSDGFDSAIRQRRDDVKDRDMDSWEARDPLKEVCDRYVEPGMRGKFLSAQKIKENSGTGDYEVVKDANGDPVRVRGLVLGQMPEQRAEARNRHYRERGNHLLKQMNEQYKQEGGATAVTDQ